MPTREWYSLFTYAADLTKDPTVRTWLEDAVLRMPDAPTAPEVERARWSRDHPRPGRDATPETQRAFSELETARQAELAKRYPGDSNVIWDRWLSLRGSGAKLPLDERLAAADAFAAMMRRSPDAGGSVPPFPVALAQFYVAWHVRLDQIRDLLQTGVRDAECKRSTGRISVSCPRKCVAGRTIPGHDRLACPANPG